MGRPLFKNVFSLAVAATKMKLLSFWMGIQNRKLKFHNRSVQK